jgi:adenine-specific DNA methylase
MTLNTSIQIDVKTLERMKKNKEYPRQTYNELITKMIDCFEASAKRNQYDQFLHKIQQMKMKDLWDNDDDEAWDAL